MNRVLHFKQTEESRVYFSSDFHFFHNPKWTIPLWKSRGFNSAIEMTDNIIKSINDEVRITDKLFFMGDFCLNTSASQFEELLSRINCQNIYCIFGNHNSQIWDIYNRELKKMFPTTEHFSDLQDLGELEVYPFRYRNLIYVGNYLEFSVDGHKTVASHYPLSSWNGMSHNGIHIHGHIHSTTENYNLEGKTIDVGFDYWKRPVSFDEIKKIMDKIPRKQEGHH